MNRKDLLDTLIKVVDPLDPIKEDTVISECDDLDSLALFNLYIFLKEKNESTSFRNFKDCKTVKDLLDYMNTLIS